MEEVFSVLSVFVVAFAVSDRSGSSTSVGAASNDACSLSVTLVSLVSTSAFFFADDGATASGLGAVLNSVSDFSSARCY